jgi:putative mRNA 3-end processing factor
VLSDHADWPGLLQAIRATGCERVGLTHGQTGPLERYLREAGLDAFTLATAWRTEEDRTQHDSGDATGGVDTAEGGIDGAGG